MREPETSLTAQSGRPAGNATTFTTAPRADRFRQGDFWIGPDGRRYRVTRGLGEGSCCLAPVGRGGARIYLRLESVTGFRRIHWGGQA